MSTVKIKWHRRRPDNAYLGDVTWPNGVEEEKAIFVDRGRSGYWWLNIYRGGFENAKMVCSLKQAKEESQKMLQKLWDEWERM